jgi:hypothetical protein
LRARNEQCEHPNIDCGKQPWEEHCTPHACTIQNLFPLWEWEQKQSILDTMRVCHSCSFFYMFPKQRTTRCCNRKKMTLAEQQNLDYGWRNIKFLPFTFFKWM